MSALEFSGHPGARSWIDRRGFVLGTAAVGMTLGTVGGTAYTFDELESHTWHVKKPGT
jgi:hypothetical protein